MSHQFCTAGAEQFLGFLQLYLNAPLRIRYLENQGVEAGFHDAKLGRDGRHGLGGVVQTVHHGHCRTANGSVAIRKVNDDDRFCSDDDVTKKTRSARGDRRPGDVLERLLQGQHAANQ
jgi:hypothetical protein